MGLLNKAREFFGFGPKLRNKAGGYAFINSTLKAVAGSDVLLNRVVKTVRMDAGVWLIEPVQKFRATTRVRMVMTGDVYEAGQTVCIEGIADECLTPIPGDLCSNEEVSSLYQSNPTKETA